MSDKMNPSSGNGPGRGRFLVSRRTIGILIMIAGAAAFFYSRVAFTDQVLCLGISTLIVFAGLAIILQGRRPTAEAQPTHPREQQGADVPRLVFRRKVPRGLLEESRRRAQVQAKASSSIEAQPPIPPVQKIPIARDEAQTEEPVSLLDQVIALLNEQGAQVTIETEREDASGSRGILRVQSPDGLPYSVMVLESDDPVDVADVRALFALVSSSGSAGGYLFASAPFTQRAYEWAGPRHIHLVQEDELGEMSI